MSDLVFSRCQSHGFASPLGQGERTEVRSSDVAGGISRFEQPSPFPLSLAKGEAIPWQFRRTICLNIN
jgi:hypothetical protein